MSEIKWSPEQLNIINNRNNNLLVSAAAGAGKTTVMVERVLGLITEKNSDIDIDKLLIVTFTRDAAANMRDKLSTRLAKMLDEDPGNRRLQRQQMLLQNAQITTIDSFCNSVVKEFFYRIDIDPSFRIADEAEITLLKNKVLDELLEEKYSGDDSDFIMLVETFCGSKNDDKIGELVMGLARAAYAQAWPADWLDGLENDIRVDIGAVTLRKEWKDKIVEIASRTLNKAVEASADAVKEATDAVSRLTALGTLQQNDPKAQKLMTLLNTENSMIASIAASKDYDTLGRQIRSAKFDKITLVKDFDDGEKEKIKKARKIYKDVVGKIDSKWFAQSEEEYAQRCSEAAKPLAVLIGLTKEYLERLLAQKKDKSLFEFSDISHFALEILAQKNDIGEYEATEAALELRDRFHDIFIDEYQDSDSVQEQIAEIIAGKPGTSPYTFMVGDVKQSIYKFRMAKPELFIARAHRYEQDETQGQLIHLGLNYRSGREVIDSVNDVFRLCMHENVGKVEYDKSAELVCGKTDIDTGNSKTNVGSSEKDAENSGSDTKKLETDITEIILVEQEKVSVVQGTAQGVATGTQTAAQGVADGSQTAVQGEVVGSKAIAQEEADGSQTRTDSLRSGTDVDKESSKGETGGDTNGDTGEKPVDPEGNEDDDADADNGTSSSATGGFDIEEYDATQLCAKAAAIRIRELFDNKYQVAEKDKGLRNIRYGDIAILLRSAGTSGEVYREELEKAGIPVFSESSQGFLGSYEIAVVVNFLRLLDNPYQDIPLVSVLNSVMGRMDDEDLAKIRVFGGFDCHFWKCVKKYAKEGPEQEVKEKCERFLAIYSDIRRINMARDIDKVIFAIYERTGFYLYCMALPSGQSRVSNLDQLMMYASKFEKNNSNGLFDFVGYLEEVTKAKNDLDEAVAAEGFDAVRIMTIHKSKGLEYPVVIIGDAAKQFNMQDRNREVIISPDYGISSKSIDLSRRVKRNTIRRTLMAGQIELDTIGEELRLLYVAMTRAMKKLIVIGKPGKKGKTKADWEKAAEVSKGSGRYTDHYTASIGGYMDILYPAALLHPTHFKLDPKTIKSDLDDDAETRKQLSKAAFADIPVHSNETNVDSEIMKELNYSYETDPGAALPVKLSVSDLKHAYMDEEDAQAFSKYNRKHTANKAKKGLTGAELGTLYHKVMQFIPFELEDAENVKKFLDSIVMNEEADDVAEGTIGRKVVETAPGTTGGASGEAIGRDACGNGSVYDIITSEERAAIDDGKIATFIETDLCRRMCKAERAGLLTREQPFMLGLEAGEADPVKYEGRKEMILVQGIIDCMFEEDDGIVILDYKTDALEENGEETLKGRYRKQLDLYAEAASRILQKKVKEKVLYSFSLGKCIWLE
ncbi:MAG: UvrD-helicase domain-containing protein [Lachnospiraceae bacterium]|nr:UvrD-helicase domain-containing protein [Lachnospiraceae bacterium]